MKRKDKGGYLGAEWGGYFTADSPINYKFIYKISLIYNIWGEKTLYLFVYLHHVRRLLGENVAK